MSDFNLSPRLQFYYTIEGNPVVYVEGKDRSGKALMTSADYLSSLYSPYLQFFLRNDEESPYEEVKSQTIETSLYIYPENNREFDVLVRLYDKMPLDDQYSQYDEAQVLITIPKPQIQYILVQDCRRRTSDCGAEIEYDLSPITGEILMNVHFLAGWKFLSKIEVYASKDEKEFPLDEEHYVTTYYAEREANVHQISITQIEPYFDYFFTLVPYDNIGEGIIFRDGYGYLCPNEEQASCITVKCIDFIADARGDEVYAIEQNTAFVKVNNSAPILFDGFDMANWQTATYSIQAKSESGNTYFNEYYLTLNNAGDLINTSVGGEHMNMGASPLEFKISHYITTGYCGLLVEVYGEGFSNDRQGISYGALVPSGNTVNLDPDEVPNFVIEGSQILGYNEISYFEIIYPNNYIISYYSLYKNAKIYTRKKVIIPGEYVGQPDTEYWEYTEVLSSISQELITSTEEGGVNKIRYNFPKFSTEPFSPNQDDIIVFNRDSDEYYVKFLNDSGQEAPGGMNWFRFRESATISPDAQNRFFKVPLAQSLGGGYAWISSSCGVETYGLFPYQYSYPYRGVRPPQEPRDSSGDWPLTDNSVNLFENGWIMVGNIFNTSSNLKLQKLYFVVSDSLIADTIVSSGVRLEINRVSPNDEDIYYKTSEPAQFEDDWNGYSIVSFDKLAMPYDGSSPEGWRLYAVYEDGSLFENFKVKTVQQDEKLKDTQIKFLSSFSTKTKQKIPKKNDDSPNSYYYTGKRIGSFAYAEPYYNLKHPVVVKGFRTTF